MANASLVVFGVPKGFDCTRCESETKNFLLGFYNGNTGGQKFGVIRRYNNEVHYVFLVYKNRPEDVFSDCDGRDGAFFGMSLYLKNQQFANPQKIRKILQTVYDNYIKNKIVEEKPNGVRHFLLPELKSDDDRVVKYVANGLMKTIQSNPEFNLANDIKPLPPIQNQTQRD